MLAADDSCVSFLNINILWLLHRKTIKKKIAKTYFTVTEVRLKLEQVVETSSHIFCHFHWKDLTEFC